MTSVYPEINNFFAAVARTQTRHGEMIYLKGDAYIGRGLELYGELSEGETVLFQQILRPNSVVVEAGANIGLHTLPLARAVGPGGRVIAFEPQRIIFQILCANLALNGIANVLIRNEAVGDNHAGDQWIHVPPVDYSSPENFGGIELGGDRGERVRVTSIDSLNLSQLDLLKADVEGMELFCLKGATDTIRRLRPILYVENNRPHLAANLNKFMMDVGYRLWWHIPPLYESNNFKNNPQNVFPATISINVLALPNERKIEVKGGLFRAVERPEEDWRSRFV